MKKLLVLLLTLLLVLPMLIACKPTEDDGTQPPNADTPAPEEEKEDPPPVDTAYRVTESYLPEAFAAQMKAYFEDRVTGFDAYTDRANAPLVSTDIFALGGARLKSITIPVLRTAAADSNGDFTFTLYVLPTAWAKLRVEMGNPKTVITLKINGEAHGLEENTIARKFITLDLTEYDISLAEDETLGFAASTDTLIPGRVVTGKAGAVDYAPKSEAAQYMIDNHANALGYYYYDHSNSSVSTAFGISDNSLLFDFELERTYESKEAYDALVAAEEKAAADYAAKLAAVKAAYTGKAFSLIGDSISTYRNITNSADYHTSLPLNAVYYSENGVVSDYTKTYWGKLSVDTGMELCVINSWSGGKVYGDKEDLVDNMLTRSCHLTHRNGTKPDVVFLYYAINDLNNSPSSTSDTTASLYTGNRTGALAGDLYQRLVNTADSRTDSAIVAEWFEQVQEHAAENDYVQGDPSTVLPGTTYITWEAAYALALQNIKARYPDAEIYIFTLLESNHSAGRQDRLDRANTVLRALAEYFEIDLVDQQKSEIKRDNCHAYTRDAYGLHPNVRGHAATTKLIVETLYEKLPK